MKAEADAIPVSDSNGKSGVKSDVRRRVKGFDSTPYRTVAILAFVAMASSAVWLVIGGSWWLPVSVAVSAVSMIVVCSCVYNCWIQRKSVHESFSSKK